MLENCIHWIWYATPVVQAALVVKLLKLGLASTYVWFFVWMCFGLLQNLVLMAMVNQPATYTLTWIVSLVFTGVLEVGAAWEVFWQRSQHYGGVRAFGRGLLIVVIVVAVAAALFVIGAEIRAPGLQRIAKTTLILKRTLDSALALFLLAAGAVFLFFHETRVKQNIVRHFSILAGYFTAIAGGFLTGNLTGRSGYTWVNLWFGLVSLGCFGLWLWAFRTQGEHSDTLPPSSPEERERLQHLDSQLRDLLKSVL